MAGKRIKGATITFEVTDDGTLRAVGQKAKGAKKGLDGVSKSTRDVNRNMQAMSGRVESGTKGFARMQQGTGGLVQTYAILASTLFAVGAAFRALENAANIQNQIKGFKELAAITGTSMLTTTAAVRQATGGLLEFQAAAQQTAIATAAGFSRDQIVGLAEGAKLASVALGRDMTDSFNRLIRGVTKAEPELLDELGIILRLDIATRKFAASQGLIAEKLTISQRRMAVFNEVQKQLEENFGAFGSEADQYLNSFTRFATTISDVAKDIGKFVTGFLEPFVGFLDRSSGALGLLLTVIAVNMIQQVIPATQNMTASITAFGDRAKKDFKDYDVQLKKLTAQQKKAGKKTISLEQSVSKAFKADLKKRGVDAKFFEMKRFQDQKAHITKYLKTLPRKTKAEKAAAKKIEIVYKAAYKKIEMAQRAGVQKQVLSLKRVGLSIEKFVTVPALKAKQAIAFLGTGLLKLAPIFRVVGMAASSLMSVLMVLMTADFILELFSSSYKATKEALADLKDMQQGYQEQLEETTNILGGFFKNHNKALEDGKIAGFEAAGAIKFLGNALANLRTPEQITEELDKINKIVMQGDGFFNFGRVQRKARSGIGTLLQNEITTALSDPKAAQQVMDELEKVFLGASTRMYEEAYGSVPMVTNPALNFEGNFAEYNAQTFGKELDAIMALIKVDATRQQGLAKLNNLLKGSGDLLVQNVGLVTELADGTFILNDSGMTFLSTLRSLTDESKKAGQGIIGLEEASANLRQTIDNLLPKPTMFSNFVSGFAAVVNEIKEGNLDEYSLEIDGKVYTGRLAALHVLTKQLGLEKEVAEQVLAQRDILSNIFEKTDELIRKEKQYLSLLDTQKKRIMFFDTALNRRRAKEIELQKVEAQRIRALGEFKSFEELFDKFNNEKSEQMKDQLGQQLAQVEALEAQSDILAGQLNIAKELAQTLAKAFDQAGTSALKDLFIGEKDTGSIKDKFVKDIRDANAGFLANKTMELGQGLLMKIPGMSKLGEALGVGGMSKEAQEFQKVHLQHITGMASVLDQHVKGIAAINGVPAPSVTPDSGTGAGGDKGTGATAATDDAKDKTDKKTANIIGDNIEEVVKPDVSTERTGFSAMFGDMGGIFDVFLGDLKGIFKGDGTTLFGEGGLFANLKSGFFGGDGEKGIFGNFFSNLTGEGGGLFKAFEGLMGGAGMGSILGKATGIGGALGGGLGGILSGIFGGGGGLSGLLKPLAGMIPGLGGLLSILPFAKGGIIGNKMYALERGGVMPRYAKGGVATQPTYLVGEGKQNEAVVPLPDNKSIPVDLGSGAGNQNNTNITVNMADGSSEMTTDGGAELAKAIDAAVQTTIEKELRPGGILSGG